MCDFLTNLVETLNLVESFLYFNHKEVFLYKKKKGQIDFIDFIYEWRLEKMWGNYSKKVFQTRQLALRSTAEKHTLFVSSCVCLEQQRGQSNWKRRDNDWEQSSKGKQITYRILTCYRYFVIFSETLQHFLTFFFLFIHQSPSGQRFTCY